MFSKIIKNTFLNSHVPSSVMSAAFLITIAGLMSRILGLFRDRLLASTFGAGDTLDIYYAAFRIPDLIYNMLILGALSAAFIPIFTGLISNEKEKEAWKLVNGVMNLAVGLIIICGIIFCIFSPYLMKIITPGFSPEKMEKVVLFTRIMFLSPLFLGISGIFGGILTSYKRFFIYSLAPIFYNLGIIFGIIFFVRFWGPIGLAWGVVLGAFLHLLTQYPSSRQLGFRYSWSIRNHFSNIEVRKVFRLMIPRTLGIAVNQINLFVITIFASFLASGSLAIFSFAQNLQSVPLGIIGVSFAIAVFPTLSALHSKKDKDGFITNFSETFRQILFFIIPLSAFILLLRAQIVRVILGSGQFDWEDTVLTFQCLGIFSLSLFAQCLVPLLARAFYAMHNTKTPFYVALVTETVNILAVILLIGKYKILSLAMAFSLSSLVQMLLLLFLLRLKYENLDDKKIISSVGKIVLATLFSGAVIQASKYLVVKFIDLDTFLGVFSQLSVSAILGALVFLAVSHLTGLEEYFTFKKSITRRIFKKEKIILAEDIGEVSGM
ncbi:MAG: murein biosynthesis integral membrane protein MurJ [Candidatus Moranbacteria bacterium RIFOXYA12_FULL_35_19]|nr:MAG: Integral membrane protein MviN [Candidatus Moranbacteria bacterium GW2011_GWF2_35_39]OGI32718.1 MAG: murein biosynthesis integral membrane protein MurJ [Candidatus Moranbacteria bacterium RIFOXYC12_FULL_36_13]OGI36680.1 MAG: murein biosynthesis integral membrane protein MurJ [Candidatus Moranbacteria bacterium RIFOXYA12_FULL_35_19]